MADDRLRLIFTCCHPALSAEAQVALTLRLLGGLTTADVARSFLVPEPTMAQRLVRAKRKIRAARKPAAPPGTTLIPLRNQDRTRWDRALIAWLPRRLCNTSTSGAGRDVLTLTIRRASHRGRGQQGLSQLREPVLVRRHRCSPSSARVGPGPCERVGPGVVADGQSPKPIEVVAPAAVVCASHRAVKAAAHQPQPGGAVSGRVEVVFDGCRSLEGRPPPRAPSPS